MSRPKSKLHWFEARWMVELLVQDSLTINEVCRRFHRTQSTVLCAVERVTGQRLTQARLIWWRDHLWKD